MPFQCSFGGNCEYTANGTFPTEQDCLEDCQATDQKELLYAINGYDFEGAQQLAPSDQIEIIRRVYGFRPISGDAGRILEALSPSNVYYGKFSDLEGKYPELTQAFAEKFDVIDRMIANLEYTLFVKYCKPDIATYDQIRDVFIKHGRLPISEAYQIMPDDLGEIVLPPGLATQVIGDDIFDQIADQWDDLMDFVTQLVAEENQLLN
jgi:hypothetical protein